MLNSCLFYVFNLRGITVITVIPCSTFVLIMKSVFRATFECHLVQSDVFEMWRIATDIMTVQKNYATIWLATNNGIASR